MARCAGPKPNALLFVLCFIVHRMIPAFFLALVSSLVPAAASSQAPVAVRIKLSSPTPPPLVDVQPGVQVLADFDEEVFFTGGWFWLRRVDGWYRAPWPQATFAYIDWRTVPAVLLELPPGRFKRWHQAAVESGPSEMAQRHVPPLSPPSPPASPDAPVEVDEGGPPRSD